MTKRARKIKEVRAKEAREATKQRKAKKNRCRILLDAFPQRVYLNWFGGPKTIDLDDPENIDGFHTELCHDIKDVKGGKLIAEYVLVKTGRTLTGVVTEEKENK